MTSRRRMVAIACAGLLVAAQASSAAATSKPSYIQPDGAGPLLSHPSKFHWTGYGDSGTTRSVKWKAWGASKATGRGFTKICVTMGGGCLPRVAVRIAATDHRGLSFAGTPEYVYCKVKLTGRLDPGRRQHVVSVSLATPSACQQT